MTAEQRRPLFVISKLATSRGKISIYKTTEKFHAMILLKRCKARGDLWTFILLVDPALMRSAILAYTGELVP